MSIRELITWNQGSIYKDPESILMNLYKISKYINYPFDKKTCKALRKDLKKIVKKLQKE